MSRWKQKLSDKYRRSLSRIGVGHRSLASSQIFPLANLDKDASRWYNLPWWDEKKRPVMKIVENKISVDELKQMAERMFGNIVKAVVDLDKEIMAVDGELHADEEAILLENGSRQENLWGINIYPYLTGEDFIEFDSMINLRPSQGNLSRGIDNPDIRKKILQIIAKLVEK